MSKAIAEMTSVELVEEYNRITGKNIKKFANRAAGIKAVEAAAQRAGVAQQEDNTEKKEKLKPGQVHDPVARAAAISASWANPEVHKARCTHHGVKVDGVQYRSVAEAFKSLKLSMNKHIAFRKLLKASGKETFEGHVFEITELPKKEKVVKEKKAKKEAEAAA